MKKKFFAILTLLIFVFTIMGCSNSEESEDSTPKSPTLTYIGHASVKIVSKDGKVIYIDPAYEEGDYSQKADFILVTHEHDDHNKVDKCTQDSNTVIIRSENALVDGKYKTFDYDNIKIETVISGGNANHSKANCVGYIVTVDGVRVFHAGDTSKHDKTETLKGKDIDYAMYPIDGTYNMDAKEATEVANIIGAKHNIPIHEFDMGDVKKSDNFTPDNKLVLEYGQTIDLEK